MDEQVYNEFIHDAQELIEKLFRDIEELRAVRFLGRHRREVVARLFRHIHTMKGSASSHGAKAVSLIAHEFENVLDAVRLGRLTLDEDALDIFASANNAMAAALGALERRKGVVDSAKVIDRLRAIASETENKTRRLEVRSSLPEEIARSLSEYDEQHLREAIQEGSRLFIVSAALQIQTFDEKFRELSQTLSQIGEIICTVPAPEPAATGEINFRVLYAAESMTDEIIESASPLGRIEFSEIVPEGITPPPVQAALPAQSLRTYTPADSATRTTIRVGLNQLDEIISDASELFRDAATALGSLATETNRQAIESAGAHLRHRFVELEERLIKLRLVPLGQLFQRAAVRAGRVAARNLGKDIEFEITGGEVGIDRSLADAITEPLMHIVRNAVSHGVEAPKERLAAGKSAHGKVRIAAFTEVSHIHICVTDDGRGIAPQRIAAVAAEEGIIPSGSRVTMAECLRLIFRPGFSTAETLSDLSGRGIGLDVVDRAMALAGGEVRVTTEPGAGTTFEMIMPATLALLHCVIIRSAEQRFCIESSRIVDRCAFELKPLKESADLIDWKDEELPLVHLRALLGQPGSTERKNGTNIIIARTSNRKHSSAEVNDRIALIVDGIEGEHEILVRSLGRHAARWRGTSGATELLDGSVALVLDLNQLILMKSESGA